MPNIENIDKLIAIIENEDNFFNMWDYDYSHFMAEKFKENNLPIPNVECGSPACICGWIEHYIYENEPYETPAFDWLGLDYCDAHDLFYPPNISSDNWFKISRQDAIKTLEILKDTGIVSWNHVKETEI